MINLLIMCAGFVLLIALLIAEKKAIPKWILMFKAPLSAFFVTTAIIQPHPMASYYHAILAGLICGLAGDVCLAVPGKNAFRAGLVAFLLGHILYIVAFMGLINSSQWFSPAHLVLAAVSIGIFMWLRPHLGKMLIPVAAYIIVISVMMAVASVVFFNTPVNRAGGWSVLIGASCFYLSDILVARDRFVAPQFVNKLMGLPMYYAGQFLIAFSVGLVR
ncbi:MAG: lysoplasmalogenase [Desulfomonilaceae bacterium]